MPRKVPTTALHQRLKDAERAVLKASLRFAAHVDKQEELGVEDEDKDWTLAGKLLSASHRHWKALKRLAARQRKDG